jgi:DNA-binding MarR family transcriptional regulator
VSQHNPFLAYPGFLLQQAASRSQAALAQALSPLALTVGQASVLHAIAHNPRTTATHICAMLGIIKTNMTPLIARLEEKALISRVQANGRMQYLFVTAAGAELAEKVAAVFHAHEHALVAHIPQEKRNMFMVQLKAISTTLNGAGAG